MEGQEAENLSELISETSQRIEKDVYSNGEKDAQYNEFIEMGAPTKEEVKDDINEMDEKGIRKSDEQQQSDSAQLQDDSNQISTKYSDFVIKKYEEFTANKKTADENTKEDMNDECRDSSQRNGSSEKEENLEKIDENYEVNSESQEAANEDELDIGNDVDNECVDFSQHSAYNPEANEEYEEPEETYEEKRPECVYSGTYEECADSRNRLRAEAVAQVDEAVQEWKGKREEMKAVNVFDINVERNGIGVEDETETTSKACCDFCHIS